MRFIIWERSVQKKTDFWIVLCCILKEPKINMLEFSCWCKKNSQSIHEELHSIPLIFLNKKSEIWNDFTIFEKWKVKNFLPSLFSRSESENQMTQNRDREVKVKIKWLKIEIEKWIFKKILENSRESRLSLVTVIHALNSNLNAFKFCSHFFVTVGLITSPGVTGVSRHFFLRLPPSSLRS